VIRAEVRRAIDTYAPYGSFIFVGNVTFPDAEADRYLSKLMPLLDEAATYGRTFYSNRAAAAG
jgi:hypothetical protein